MTFLHLLCIACYFGQSILEFWMFSVKFTADDSCFGFSRLNVNFPLDRSKSQTTKDIWMWTFPHSALSSLRQPTPLPRDVCIKWPDSEADKELDSATEQWRYRLLITNPSLFLIPWSSNQQRAEVHISVQTQLELEENNIRHFPQTKTTGLKGRTSVVWDFLGI